MSGADFRAVMCGGGAAIEGLLRGKLLTGDEPLYLSATIVGNEGINSELSHSPPWPVDDKIVAEELGPYPAARNAARG